MTFQSVPEFHSSPELCVFMSKVKPLALYLAQRHTLTLNDFSHFLWLNPSLALCAEHGCWSPACTAETPFANAVAVSTSPAGTLFLGVKGSNTLPTLLTTKGEEKLVTLMIQVYASYCSHFPPHQKIKREKKKILILPHNHFKWTLFFQLQHCFVPALANTLQFVHL